MRHRAAPRFWVNYNALPQNVRSVADRYFALLREDRAHPSLQLKKVGQFWSVRVGLHYRALAVEEGSDILWFWIGTHAEYDAIIATK